MTPEEADKAQQWIGMDGAIAWHLIERHADDWGEIGELMNAWLRANVAAERESCAVFAEGATAYTQFQTVEHYKIASVIAAAIRERSNA